MNQNKIRHFIDNWRLNWRRKPFVNSTFLIIMIVMYLVMSFNGGSQNPYTLVLFGAKVNELIAMGDWWRLITPTFLHIGLPHILFNGLVIYFLGAQIEAIIGHIRYFLLFLLSALMGNAASFALNDSISAGASTAIFGLFASTIVLAKFYPYRAGIQSLSRNYLVLIIINVIFGLFSTTVDNAGHIGGLVGGYLIMYALSAPDAMNSSKKQQFFYGAIYIVVLTVLIFIGFMRTDTLYY